MEEESPELQQRVFAKMEKGIKKRDPSSIQFKTGKNYKYGSLKKEIHNARRI